MPRPARRRSSASPARSIMRPEARTTTASARSHRSCSTASATRPFPASVCGVVYQGSTRATGCQFTFTCDGSLYRQPDADGWKPRLPHRRRPRSPARSMRRSATRPIITPIMSSPTGPRPWPRTRSSARTSSIAGPAAGASPRPSPRPMPGSEPKRARAAHRRACRVPHVDRRQPRRASPQAIAGYPGRRTDQAGAVDARRQARRGPLQPRRAQGVGRGDARGLCQEVRGFGQSQMDAVGRYGRRAIRSRSARPRPRRGDSAGRRCRLAQH